MSLRFLFINGVVHINRSFFQSLRNRTHVKRVNNNCDHRKLKIYPIALSYPRVVDDPLVCCMMKKLNVCDSGRTVISLASCSNLLDYEFARSLLWTIAIITALGNMTVVATRVCRRDLKKTSSVLVLNLALADFLLSIYLFIILASDISYRHVYFENHIKWRDSPVCKGAEFIFILSTEVSVMTLAGIAAERLVIIFHPDVGIKMASHPLFLNLVCLAIWLISTTLSAIPFIPVNYFSGQFVWSPICLPIPVAQHRPPGWEYITALVLGLNATSLLFVVGSYGTIFVYVLVRVIGDTVSVLLARELAVLILADCFCWLPVLVLHILALSSGAFKRVIVYTYIYV